MKKYKYLLASSVCLMMFIPIMILANSHPYFPIDLRVASIVQGIHIPFLDKVMVLVSIPGYGKFKYILFLVISAVLLILKKKRELLFLIFSSLGVEIFNILVKHFVGRERPAADLIHYIYKVENSASFPSGHVMYYVGFFGFLFFLSQKLIIKRNLRFVVSSICLFFIFTIGLSRIYLGAHWFSDVVGAYFAGLGWLFLSIFMYNSPNERKN